MEFVPTTFDALKEGDFFISVSGSNLLGRPLMKRAKREDRAYCCRLTEEGVFKYSHRAIVFEKHNRVLKVRMS